MLDMLCLNRIIFHAKCAAHANRSRVRRSYTITPTQYHMTIITLQLTSYFFLFWKLKEIAIMTGHSRGLHCALETLRLHDADTNGNVETENNLELEHHPVVYVRHFNNSTTSTYHNNNSKKKPCHLLNRFVIYCLLVLTTEFTGRKRVSADVRCIYISIYAFYYMATV